MNIITIEMQYFQIKMFVKFGRYFLLLSIPILILLLVSYLGNGSANDTYTKSGEESSVLLSGSEESSKLEWKVLHDGTVVHLGNEILDRNYSFPINHVDKCRQLKNTTTSFLIVVESNIINFDERQQIRDTWALDVMQEIGNYRVIFLVGTTDNIEVQVSF